MHHALSDGWTLDLLQDDLKALCDGRKAESRPSFAEVSRWWRTSAVVQAQRAIDDYWARYMKTAKPPNWPALPSLTFTPSTRCAAVHCWQGDLSTLSRSHGITTAIASRVAVYLALLRSSSLTDLVVGIVRSGRDIPVRDADAIIGPCVSVLPARAGLVRSGGSFLDVMRAEAKADHEARRHQRISLSSLSQLASARGRLFSTLITYQSLAERAHADTPPPISEPPESIVMPTVYALSIELTPVATVGGPGMDLHAYYDERVLAADEAERLLATLAQALDAIVADPFARVGSFLPSVVDDEAGDVRVPMRDGVVPCAQQEETKGEADPKLAEVVKRCWSQVLRLPADRLDVYATFAHLGGDSVRGFHSLMIAPLSELADLGDASERVAQAGGGRYPGGQAGGAADHRRAGAVAG
jgi:hypothetical protein